MKKLCLLLCWETISKHTLKTLKHRLWSKSKFYELVQCGAWWRNRSYTFHLVMKLGFISLDEWTLRTTGSGLQEVPSWPMKCHYITLRLFLFLETINSEWYFILWHCFFDHLSEYKGTNTFSEQDSAIAHKVNNSVPYLEDVFSDSNSQGTVSSTSATCELWHFGFWGMFGNTKIQW